MQLWWKELHDHQPTEERVLTKIRSKQVWFQQTRVEDIVVHRKNRDGVPNQHILGSDRHQRHVNYQRLFGNRLK